MSLNFFANVPLLMRDFVDKKVAAIAKDLRTDPWFLLCVMDLESSLKTTAKNPITGAIGLIQFMPSTLAQWSLTTTEVAAMTYEQQLDLVKRYLSPYKGKLNSLVDTYLAVFYPAAMNKGDDYTFSPKVAKQNTVLDYDKDGKLTVGDIRQKLEARYGKKK